MIHIMEKKVTATDVAKKAGVSQSSVSRVYFKGASVSENTRKKVLRAAEALGYRPNEFARGLITNKTKIIGLVMKGVHNPFYPEVLKQFTSSFKARGYSVLFVHTNHDEIQQEDIDVLLNYNVAGVVITDASVSLEVASDFKKHKIPLVFFNRKISKDGFYTVCCNNLDAGKEIAHYLIEKGSREMVYISGNENTSTSIEREQGFAEILAQKNLTYERYSSDYTYRGGYETALSIIGKGHMPEAFFVANDIMALGVIDALCEKGIQPAIDTKVIGFDNIEMASWPHYSLTTWEQPITKMIEQTIQYLMSEIVEYTGLSDGVEVNGQLIERKTT